MGKILAALALLSCLLQLISRLLRSFKRVARGISRVAKWLADFAYGNGRRVLYSERPTQMFVVAQTLLYSQTLIDALLASLGTRPAAALLATPTVHLYTGAHTPNPVADTAASFTEATFTGYTAQALTLGSTVNTGSNGRGKQGDVDFLCTTSGIFAAITGAWIDDGTGPAIYGQVAFDTPIPISNAGDQLSLDFVFPLLFRQIWN